MAITRLSNSGIATGGVLKYDSMLAGNPAFIPNSFESIATLTASGGESTLNFTNIPQTYTHLQVRGIGRLNGTQEGYGYSYVTFNDVGGACHYLNSVGSGLNNGGTTASQYQIPCSMTPSNAPANVYGYMIFDILDYSATNKKKMAFGFSGYATNNTSGAPFYQGVGYSSILINGDNAVINKITISSGPFGETFVAGSTYALYGIKGS